MLLRRMPRSLWSRAILAIVIPIIIMQLFITWMFFNMHWETVTSRLSEGLAGDIDWAVKAYEAAPSMEQSLIIATQAAGSMQLSIKLLPNEELPKSVRQNLYAPLDKNIDTALKAVIDHPFWFDTSRYPGFVDIRIKVTGGVMRIYAPKDRAFATTGHIFIVWMVLATLILTLAAIGFIRNQIRAIERLAKAAEAFGKGEEDPDFKPYGAREVRSAAEAFLKMKARIARHIEQRTRILASVSHDLRTPLTRMKLELAMFDKQPAVERMKSDISEMAHMIDEYLAFARGEMNDTIDEVSLRVLLEQINEKMIRAGHKLKLSLPLQDIRIMVREMALERAITNLIQNGFYYGKNVSLHVDSSHAREGPKRQIKILIDDDGPGIDPSRYEEAFTPFSRLDESRNQNIKGVGLGLAIARDTVRAHGGELHLEKSPMGGLRAVIDLPLVS